MDYYIHCKRVKSIISASKALNTLTSQESSKTKGAKKLNILSIYPERDVELWQKTDYPNIVINSYDKGCKISEKELYDLKAIPTLYLLDAKKHIILKDAPIEIIEEWLSSQPI